MLIPKTARWSLAVTVVAIAVLAPGPAAHAADAYRCEAPVSTSWSALQVQLCPLTSPEAGGRIPVYKSPVGRARGAALPGPQGWLNGTANQYFLCQQQFGAAPFHHSRGWRNNWWSWTKGDVGGWGWVPGVYFRGGDDDEPDAGLRNCDAKATPRTPDKRPPKPRKKNRKVTRAQLLNHAKWIMNRTSGDFLAYKRKYAHKGSNRRFNWSADGCSNPPGTDLDFKDDFTPACILHDFGYRNFGRGLKLGRNEDTRGWIDDRFLSEMRRICNNDVPWTDIAFCHGAAGAWWTSLRHGGRDAFYHGR